MTAPSTETDMQTLQRQVEQAIRAARPREHIVRLLQRLLEVAPDASEAARFAHRHLAELTLEEQPWEAALHLRRVLQSNPDDDAAQALMGLCHALLGNYRVSVTAYRRAVAIAPGNPWYNHNLGHLLDVALGVPAEALGYLRRAYRAAPNQEEVGASLAHCLGRVGLLDEGLALARQLSARHPKHQDLRTLVRALESGDTGSLLVASKTATRAAPVVSQSRPARASAPAEATAVAPVTSKSSASDAAMERLLTGAGCPQSVVARGLRLGRDLHAQHPRLGPPTQALAAAIEYALSKMDGRSAGQKIIATRHGVSVSALSNRYATIRDVLHLVPRDARYLRRAED